MEFNFFLGVGLVLFAAVLCYIFRNDNEEND